MSERETGWYRVKFSGRWLCVEWKDPGEGRGGWQFDDRMDPQPWEDRNFEEIGDRVTMPDELPNLDEFYQVRNTPGACGRLLAPGQYWVFCGETDMGQTGPALCTQCGGEFRLKGEDDFTPEQGIEIRGLTALMRQSAALVGPQHAWWDVIHDMDQFLVGHKTVMKMTASERIDYLKKELGLK